MIEYSIPMHRGKGKGGYPPLNFSKPLSERSWKKIKIFIIGKKVDVGENKREFSTNFLQFSAKIFLLFPFLKFRPCRGVDYSNFTVEPRRFLNA